MLRYKVYALVTHPYFLRYAFIASIFGYFLAVYVLFNPQLIEEKAFVSENALTANSQRASFSFSDSKLWVPVDNAHDFLAGTIGAKHDKGVHTYLVNASRAAPSENIAFFCKLENAEALNIYRDFIQYVEKHNQWLGNSLLFVFYSNTDDAIQWLEQYGTAPKFYYGIIRAAFVWELPSSFGYLTMNADGFDGLQTDIDMVESVRKLAKNSKLPFKFPILLSFTEWKEEFTLKSGMLHPYLLEQGILSVSVYGTKGTRYQLADLKVQLSSFFELISRTFTALDEQLHAGYYFYYYTSDLMMVPLSKYANVVTLMILPILLKAIMILKEDWCDLPSLVLLCIPYFALLADLQIGCPLLTVLSLLARIFITPKKRILEAYSNLTLALAFGLCSLRILKLPMMLGWFVGCKWLVSWSKLAFIAAVPAILNFGVYSLWSLDQTRGGSYLLAYTATILWPSTVHMSYLII